jgi:integrase
MKGGIYENKGGKGSRYIVKYPGGIYRRFGEKSSAEKFLIGLNFKEGEGSLDPRDYHASQPLGFSNLVTSYQGFSKAPAKHFNHAIAYFGNTNVKLIGFRELDAFRRHLLETLSTKYVHNIFMTLKAFWRYQAKADKHILMPDFPATPFRMQSRKILSHETRALVLDEISRISWHRDPKIWAAISLLALNPNVRPMEILRAREQDLDLKARQLIIRMDDTKTGIGDQIVVLLPEHIEVMRSDAIGKAFVFRHRARKGIPAKMVGRPWSTQVLQDWWGEACQNLGIEGVSLYPGTKHTTANALRGMGYTPEQIKGFTGHRTGQAFRRYYYDDPNEKVEMVNVLSGKVKLLKDEVKPT